jgi:O-antigen ligase
MLDYPLQSILTARPGLQSSTKYNRGLDYLVLIAWPELAWLCWRRHWKCAVLFAVAVITALTIGSSLAGRVAVVTGAVVLALAWCMPRLVAVVLGWGAACLAALMPFALRWLATNRALLVPYIKFSAVNRLEIWDYMTARVLQRPLLGWGISSANAVPIRPEELARYVYVTSAGTYSHNQWLELWVETGALGAMAGLALATMVLRRIRDMPAPLRPFAYAAFGSAMTISCINFEVTTDSWWAALAASGFLFMTLCRLFPDASMRGNAA